MRTGIGAGALAALVVVGGGAAAGTWADTHPWLVKLHARYARQEDRIEAGIRLGQINPAQARELRLHVYAVRMQERALSHFHGGHLGPAEYKYLSRELNQNSGRIFAARHPLS